MFLLAPPPLPFARSDGLLLPEEGPGPLAGADDSSRGESSPVLAAGVFDVRDFLPDLAFSCFDICLNIL